MKTNYVYVTPRPNTKPLIVSGHRWSSKAGLDMDMEGFLTKYGYTYHPHVFQFAHDYTTIGRIYLN